MHHRHVTGVATLALFVMLFQLALGQSVAAGSTDTCAPPGGSVIIARNLTAGEHSAAAARVIVDASYSEMSDGRIRLDGWTSSELIDAVYIRTGPHLWELPGGRSGGAFVPPDGFSITQIKWCASTDSVPPTTISPPKDPGPVLPPAPTTTVPEPTTTTTAPAPTTTTTPDPGSPSTTVPVPSSTTTTVPDVPAPAPGATTTTQATTTTTTTVGRTPGASVPGDPPEAPGPVDPDVAEADVAEADTSESTITTTSTLVASTTTVAVVAATPRPEPTPETHEPETVALPLPVPSPVEDSIELFSRMTTSQQVLVGTGLGIGGLLSGIGVVRRVRMPKLP